MEKRKIRAFFISPFFLIAAEIFLSGTIAVGAIFYVYDSVIAVRAWKLALLFSDFILSSGAMFALAYFQKYPESKPIVLAAPFLVGAGVFSLLFFPSQAIASAFLNETVTRVFGLVVLLSFYLACVIVQLYYGTRRNRKFALWATAVVALGVYAASLIFSCKMLPQAKLFKAFSRDLVTFPQASAEEISLDHKDRELSRAWFRDELERSMEGSVASAAFDFRFGDKGFVETRSEWDIEIALREESGGDVTLEKVFTHRETGLEARLIASYYDLTATSEWKVGLTNRGTENSLELSFLYGLTGAFDFSDSTLYFSGGSDEATDDFALYSRELSGKKTTYVFDTLGGRSSTQYLPFFNLWGKSPSASGAIGATIGIGWSGDWTARFAAHKGHVSVNVGQSDLCGYLEPGESVRTPLISLSLYSNGSSPLKGFNNFRADIKRGLGEHYAPSSMLLFAGAEGQDDTSRANEAGTRAYIEKLKELDLLETLDYAWYDAAWYDLNGASDWRSAVGNWTVNLDKYPNGLGAVSDYLAENGAKMLLWYEPERVPKSSELYKEIQAKGKADSWLLTAKGENCLLNMGCEEAREYIQGVIIASLKENGVSYYRQDFNIDPRVYWEKADRDLYGGRKGFAENHYVTGEYAFLDALSQEIPGLRIDNCASGGRRIDL
ncbi:MAG: alpha-galactosidase, partial [Clostridia bacterium]|nr:alpha-galactosidase [Clostridia bacterium]